ncbi:cytochrome c family protein [Massilia sp. CCM 8734]|uniref:cytochrome c family protein n=1 Tax=Massilia sp. CCM 8734 TaxID=2609283 RepID=UPI0034D267A3
MRVFPLPIAVAAVLCAALAGCDKHAGPAPLAVAGGDAVLGKRLMEQYQCGACHAIPGVGAATGSAGPPLDKFGRRSYIAGRIPNLPGSLADWLVDPPAMKPGTTMPNVGVSKAEARHMAAYLYTLR